MTRAMLFPLFLLYIYHISRIVCGRPGYVPKSISHRKPLVLHRPLGHDLIVLREEQRLRYKLCLPTSICIFLKFQNQPFPALQKWRLPLYSSRPQEREDQCGRGETTQRSELADRCKSFYFWEANGKRKSNLLPTPSEFLLKCVFVYLFQKNKIFNILKINSFQ